MGALLDAARSGDERKILEALRDNVALCIDDGAAARDLAALSKRLMEITEKLAALPDPDGDVNPVDDMAEFIAKYDEYEDPRDGGPGG